jgi:hypothetical protein
MTLSVLHFTSDGWAEYNSARWRISNGVQPLRDAGVDVRVASIQDWLRGTDTAKFFCSQADIIFIHRVLVEESIEQAQFWIKRGKAVVAAFDDHYEAVDDSNPAAKYWKYKSVMVNTPYGSYEAKLDKHPIEQFKYGLAQVTAGETPSRSLTKRWNEFARMFYIPNYIDSWRYLQAKKSKNDYIVLGYGGSLGHNFSYSNSGIKEALRRVCDEFDNVRFMLVGDERIGNIVALPKDKLIYRPYISYDKWHLYLQQYDIGLAPLGYEFDTGRSPIKCIEYTTMGIPFVATGDESCRVYEDFFDCPSGRFVSYGEDAVTDAYNRRSDEWYCAIKSMVENITCYRQLAEESREYGLQFDVVQNVPNLVRTYEEILSLR